MTTSLRPLGDRLLQRLVPTTTAHAIAQICTWQDVCCNDNCQLHHVCWVCGSDILSCTSGCHYG